MPLTTFLKKLSPGRIIALGFLFYILLGSLLLMLPCSLQPGIALSYLDALYTATSAVCVTGLNVIDPGSAIPGCRLQGSISKREPSRMQKRKPRAMIRPGESFFKKVVKGIGQKSPLKYKNQKRHCEVMHIIIIYFEKKLQ